VHAGGKPLVHVELDLAILCPEQIPLDHAVDDGADVECGTVKER
jgi:hypothetical protein